MSWKDEHVLRRQRNQMDRMMRRSEEEWAAFRRDVLRLIHGLAVADVISSEEAERLRTD